MTLELWLERATAKLAPVSAEKVRHEIGEHYESAVEAELARGLSRVDAERTAVESLGSPASANRKYRKVLLTVEEASLLELWKARPPRMPKPSPALLAGGLIALGSGFIAMLVLLMASIADRRPEKFAFFSSTEGMLLVASIAVAFCVACAVFALQTWWSEMAGSQKRVIQLFFHAFPLLGFALAAASYVHFGFEIVTRFWAGSALMFLVVVTASTWRLDTPARSRAFRPFKWAACLVAVFIQEPALTPILGGLLSSTIYREWQSYSIRKKLPAKEWPPELYR